MAYLEYVPVVYIHWNRSHDAMPMCIRMRIAFYLHLTNRNALTHSAALHQPEVGVEWYAMVWDV